MDIRLLLLPYDSGHRAVRMGRGPLHLAERGLEGRLRKAGHQVESRVLESTPDLPTETTVAFELARKLAGEVRQAAEDGCFPVILAGNCFSALGTATGLGTDRTGVLWFDAHGDFNTPETSPSGFLDGMAAAALCGRCWRPLTSSIPGFEPLPKERLALIGVRDMDPSEEVLLRQSAVRLVEPALTEAVLDAAGRAIRGIGADVDHFYFHVDLDVLDPSIARANSYAAPGGLTIDQVLELAREAVEVRPIAALALTAYDPELDADGASADAAGELIMGVVEASRRAATRPT